MTRLDSKLQAATHSPKATVIRTALTAEQYSELVVALEAIRERTEQGWTVKGDLHNLWRGQLCSDWCLVYLTQWFGRVGYYRRNLPHMVAEFCAERC